MAARMIPCFEFVVSMVGVPWRSGGSKNSGACEPEARLPTHIRRERIEHVKTQQKRYTCEHAHSAIVVVLVPSRHDKRKREKTTTT